VLDNGRTDSARVATWEDFGKFDIEQIGNKYKNKLLSPTSITESMAGQEQKWQGSLCDKGNCTYT